MKSKVTCDANKEPHNHLDGRTRLGCVNPKPVPEASPAPQPEPTEAMPWEDFKKILAQKDRAEEASEQPAPPAGAREPNEAEKWLSLPQNQIGQPKHGHDCGFFVTDPHCERCRILVIMGAYAASERARAEQERLEERAEWQKFLNAAHNARDAFEGDVDKLTAEVESLRSELGKAQQELTKVYGAIPLAVLREHIPGWPEAVSRKEDKAPGLKGYTEISPGVYQAPVKDR